MVSHWLPAAEAEQLLSYRFDPLRSAFSLRHSTLLKLVRAEALLCEALFPTMIVRRQDPVPPLVEAFREAVGDIDMERVFRPGDLFKADQVKSETAISSSV